MIERKQRKRKITLSPLIALTREYLGSIKPNAISMNSNANAFMSRLQHIGVMSRAVHPLVEEVLPASGPVRQPHGIRYVLPSIIVGMVHRSSVKHFLAVSFCLTPEVIVPTNGS